MLTIHPEVIQGDEPAPKRSKTSPSKKTKAPVSPPPQLVLDLIKTMSGSQLAEFKKSVNGAIADQIKHLKEEKQLNVPMSIIQTAIKSVPEHDLSKYIFFKKKYFLSFTILFLIFLKLHIFYNKSSTLT